MNLFYGNCKTEGVNNNQRFVNEVKFGAYPVEVRGHTLLHDSLEATVHNEMGQETWFTRLPQILVLELSR